MSRVGVVVPTHRRPLLLARALASILGQRHGDLDVVVIDDRSGDRTGDLVRAIPDRRVRLLTNEVNLQVARSRNRAAGALDCELLGFCDDDDLWAPDKLTQLVDALDAAPAAGWAFASVVHVDEQLRVVEAQRVHATGVVSPLRPLLERNVVPGGGSALVVRRSLFDEVGGFDERFRGAEDWELAIRLADRAPAVAVDRPLVAYHVASAGRASNDSAHQEWIYRNVLAAHADLRAREGLRRWPDAADDYLEAIDALHGNRRSLLRRQLSRAVRTRSVRSVARAGRTLLQPRRAAARAEAHRRSTVPPTWIAETGPWLHEHREPRSSLAALGIDPDPMTWTGGAP